MPVCPASGMHRFRNPVGCGLFFFHYSRSPDGLQGFAPLQIFIRSIAFPKPLPAVDKPPGRCCNRTASYPTEGFSMSLDKLDYVLALAEERNLTRAARKAFISQPTLTNYINRLEEQLG